VTRRDYVRIARAISSIGSEYQREEDDGGPTRVPWSEILDAVVEELAEAFEEESPKFDRDRFAIAARKEWGA
jgi:hypothetical protein